MVYFIHVRNSQLELESDSSLPNMGMHYILYGLGIKPSDRKLYRTTSTPSRAGLLVSYMSCMETIHVSDYTPILHMQANLNRVTNLHLSYIVSAFFVKEYFPVPSSGGNQCKNRHAPIWHFG